MAQLKAAGESLGEFLAPTRCAGCDERGTLWCKQCGQALFSYRSHYACQHCGAPFGELVCTECQDASYAFDRVFALGTFEPPLSRAVVLYKDSGERRLGRTLGLLLARVIKAHGGRYDVVTWVPGRTRGLRDRGYDHGALLAQGVASGLNLKARATVSRAKDAQQDLRELSRDDRLRAMEKSFVSITVEHGYSRVLLVDDVMTTGATASAFAQVLKEQGVEQVDVGIVARTL